MVRRTLIQKSTPQPEMRKTPSGGIKIVMMIKHSIEQVPAMMELRK
jgi:hypothetical protein